MDWNNDGYHDLLVGDSHGNVVIYMNTADNTDPVLDNGTIIFNIGHDRATPVVSDWNDDGKKDLIIGNMEGNIIIYLNKGTDSLPTFDTPFLLQLDGKIFNAGTRSAPRIYDWNKDGLKDLLVGEMQGYVYYLKNIGTRNSPLFRKAEKLLLRNGDFMRYPDPTGNSRSRLYVTDWNDDGLNDIVLSGRDGKILLYLATSEASHSPRALAMRIWNQSRESLLNLKNIFMDNIRELKKRIL